MNESNMVNLEALYLLRSDPELKRHFHRVIKGNNTREKFRRKWRRISRQSSAERVWARSGLVSPESKAFPRGRKILSKRFNQRKITHS